MTTAYDVPADRLISSLAEDMKKRDSISPPEWSGHVKTGISRENAPNDPDWWYTRVAAVLRKVYIDGPIGTEQLSAHFGGPVDRGSKPYHAWTGSRSIIRTSLQQLEQAGLVMADKNRGRVVTPQGQSLLDNTSHVIFQELAKDNPKLAKYGS